MLRATLGVWLTVTVGAAAWGADPPAAPELSEREKAFAASLAGATLEGRFTIAGQEVDAGPKPDKYTITKVEKKDGNSWLFIARVEYERGSYPVAVKVPVEWAGDTPVICVTDLEIPIVAKGKFHARVLIDRDRYAGTWGHDEVGGHMWGTIARPSDVQRPKPDDSAAEK